MPESPESSDLDQLIADFLAAIDCGEAPSGENLTADNPHVADELQQFFDDLDGLPVVRPILQGVS